MSYGLNLGWGGPIGDYIGSWLGPIKGYPTNLIQGSYTPMCPYNPFQQPSAFREAPIHQVDKAAEAQSKELRTASKVCCAGLPGASDRVQSLGFRV